MKKPFLIAAAAVLLLNSCKKTDEAVDANTPVAKSPKLTTMAVGEYPVKPAAILKGDYTTPLHLDKSKTWFLDGLVVISNTTITIDPGTVIVGLHARETPKNNTDLLLIERNATINAKGTADEPIVFTSKYMIDGKTDTLAAPGDVGGLVVLGQAPVSSSYDQVFISYDNIADDRAFKYGGTNAAHSSGELSYVRIEYAGIATSFNQISPFHLAGVGKGTKINHVESAKSVLYGFYISGGNFDATYLVVADQAQQGYYINDGYTGSLDYGVVLTGDSRVKSFDPAGIDCVNGTGVIKTHPRINHFTIVGLDKYYSGEPMSAGVMLDDKAEIDLNNSIILGYTNGIWIWYSKDVYLFFDGKSVAKNNIITSTIATVNYGKLTSYLDSNGNKRHVYAAKTNPFTRLRQPFFPLGDVNLVPLSVSPANQGTTDQSGAFNDYSRPISRWGHAQSWYRLNY